MLLVIVENDSRNRYLMTYCLYLALPIGAISSDAPFLGLAFLTQAPLPRFFEVVRLLDELPVVADESFEVVLTISPTNARLSTKIADRPGSKVLQ